MDRENTSLKESNNHSFRYRYLLLVFFTWNIPPVFGFLFLIYVDMLSVQQSVTILLSPIEPIFILAWSVFSLAYFYYYGAPLFEFESDPKPDVVDEVLRRMKRFPLHYWTIFLAYLLMAPTSVIVSAEIYTGYVAQPIDWFRIHLVALIVSIIVGLPLFFLLLDNFGQLLGSTRLERPHLTIKVKVFLIGALTPLLIDTMLVQYYWSRTGYFSIETFWVWLSLEIIAITATLMFVKSFSQSIEPLNRLTRQLELSQTIDPGKIQAQSTDELGVLAWDFHNLIQELNVQEEVIKIRNRVLTRKVDQTSLEQMLEEIVSVADKNLDSDITFIVSHDSSTREMSIVCYSNHSYNRNGYTRISVDAPSLAALAFAGDIPVVVDDARNDHRINSAVVREYNLRSAIAVPLIVRDKKYGVLITCTQERLAFYQTRDVRLVEALAQEAALVINTVNLHYERTLAERELSVIFENMQDTFFRTNREGVVLRLSGSVEELLGYSAEELVGTNIDKLYLDPEGSRNFLLQLRNNDGVLKNYQSLMKRKDGSVVWVSTNAQYYVDDNGVTLGVEGIGRNVTEQKQSENALFQEKERAQVTLASIGDGVITTDIEGRIDYINPIAEQMLGVSLKAVEKRKTGEIVVLVDSLARHRIDPVSTCLNQRAVLSSNMDSILVSVTGREYAVEYSVSPIKDRLDHVIGAIMVLHDVTEMRRLSTQLSYQAKHDSLTGLVNRREFESRLDALLKETREGDEEHALCYLDLDQFKIVNDTCGHMAGDELLRQLAEVLKDKIRKADTLARLGGDEFGVLLSNCPQATAVNVAESIRKTVNEFRFTWEGHSFDIGVSIGLVPIVAESGSMADLLTAADNVCYLAKEQGRDRVQVYTPDDDMVARRYGEARWASRIGEAIAGNSFCLYSQKIVALSDQDAGKDWQEVLIRLDEGQGQLIPPMAFIPAAERYYLMPKIDRWVIQKSFRVLEKSNLKNNGGNRTHFSINLSGQSLSDDGFLDFVINQYRKYKFEPGDVCFEITETAAIANLSQATRFISALREFGCQFSLDDFGSGLSSFSYLKNLDVDFLKIDGSFVRDMLRDPIDREMVEAINKVGHVMGLKTVAEYVEDAQTLELLRQQGVDYVQGFAVSEPVCICSSIDK